MDKANFFQPAMDTYGLTSVMKHCTACTVHY